MPTFTATATPLIYGSRDHWSLRPFNGARKGRRVQVTLEVQGDPNNGFHLVMSPEGFFTADSHYATEHEAKEAARDLYGVPTGEWRRAR